MTNDPTTSQVLADLTSYDNSPAAMGRRRFLQGALAVGGATALLPTWLADTAAAGPPLGPDDRILIVLMMGGGNDGFKMISPLENSAFVNTRGFLADDPAASWSIGQGLYLNQYLPDIAELWNQGDVACVLGVGNPNDDRSHFSSMATWLAGHLGQPPYDSGWLGRYMDDANYDAFGALSIGDGGVPLHLRGRNSFATGISSWGDLFGASTADWDTRRYRGMHKYADGTSGISPWVDLVGDTFSSAMTVASEITPAYALLDNDEDLARSMVLAAGMINLDLGARVLGVSYGDFDHHDDQAGPYQFRMTELNQAIKRFYEELDPQFADRVVIATFSEFGRSFTPNGSRGTDHGTASNLMVIGRNVKGGMYGQLPNFTQLDDYGDVEHTVDFRSYYATLLDGWLGADSNAILQGSFENLDIFETNPTQVVGSGTAALRSSCLNFDGRFDIDIVNLDAPATFELRVSGLPPRTRLLGADESATMTVTGRREGNYTVTVLRDGVEIMDETATVACDPLGPEVEVDQSCLFENGRFDVHLHNPSSATASYEVELTGMSPRTATLAPGNRKRITWTGRPDRLYTITVRRNGAVIHTENATVACDVDIEPVRVTTSCLNDNGRVDVYLFNDTDGARTYDVTIGRLAPRSRTLAAGARTRVSATGRKDGILTVVVAAGGQELHRDDYPIGCDKISA